MMGFDLSRGMAETAFSTPTPWLSGNAAQASGINPVLLPSRRAGRDHAGRCHAVPEPVHGTGRDTHVEHHAPGE